VTHVLLVTGSREWTDRRRLVSVLIRERAEHPDLVVRHGKAKRGADDMTRQWCEDNGVPQDPMPADWNRGLAAGFARNTDMVEKEPQPYRCHAFIVVNRSPGTMDCAKKAGRAGIYVQRHKVKCP
jgi:hypothetical protein